ncbi:hypothetical protein [Camelimonas lactis]|uniref:Uncharacterized protein n=1 Tax=Camelimonas lactis TaxID=659006 RepID=A0A4V2RWB0_9HYPH|nr:hypothetical protein [Camelimonas lactis]TCO07608.1 hypothetical protein EV666_13019 [Camelimonas lactis]
MLHTNTATQIREYDNAVLHEAESLQLTQAEAAKIRRIVEHYMGENYADELADRARQHALAAGYTAEGWGERRAHAPAVLDLLVAAAPERW